MMGVGCDADGIGKSLGNAAQLAAEQGLVRFTRFLDPAQCVLAERIAASCGCGYAGWGGYDLAERVVGCFYPQGVHVEGRHYPVVCLHSRYSSRFCTISHRDLLGSFMSLGLTRSCIGDIIIAGSDIYLFAEQKVASYIAQSFTQAGRVSLCFELMDAVPVMPEPEGKLGCAVVSSLRLDAVLAAAYCLSRNDAAEQIRSGLVKVNHMPCDRVDVSLREGALLSVRGKGRVRLVSVDGFTRKQRIGITFFRYV